MTSAPTDNRNFGHSDQMTSAYEQVQEVTDGHDVAITISASLLCSLIDRCPMLESQRTQLINDVVEQAKEGCASEP